MPVNASSPAILCPLCKALLAQNPLSWTCLNGHCFDVAREGYVNLLPVQQKKSREPGDAAAMVSARRAFLDAGHYAPLRDALLQTLAPLALTHVLDIGCGEGYYTSALTQVAPQVVGLDIAKPAVQLAAKRLKTITWLVGRSAHLPLAEASVSAVTSLFSPLPVAEMARVLVPAGYVLVATPGADHLASVRSALFDELIPHVPEKFLTTLAAHFILESRLDMRFPLALNQTSLRQLLLMTPYVWRAKAEKRAALEACEQMQTEAVFTLFLLRKSAAI